MSKQRGHHEEHFCEVSSFGVSAIKVIQSKKNVRSFVVDICRFHTNSNMYSLLGFWCIYVFVSVVMLDIQKMDDFGAECRFDLDR